MRCSPRWRTSSTRRSPSGPPQCAQRPRPSSGSPGAQDRPRIPVGALDGPRHDVLEAAEGGLALALGLGRAEALVARRPRPRTSCMARRSSLAAEPSLAGGDLPVIVASHGRRAEDRRPRGRRDRAGAARAGAARARARRHRPGARARALRPLARAPPRDRQRGRRTRPRAAMREAGFGLKAATVTPEGKDDVGSPNRILREEVDGKVIIRTGRRIPGRDADRRRAPPDLRRAHGGRGRLRRQAVARGRPRARRDEVAYRTEKITRSTCRAVAEYAFRTARADGRQGLRRAEVDRLARLRGDAQGGARRRRRAPPRRRPTSRC